MRTELLKKKPSAFYVAEENHTKSATTEPKNTLFKMTANNVIVHVEPM